MKKKHKPQGHYCKICGEHKANEKFSGKGHSTHICKACHALPVLRRNELVLMRKIERIDEKFFVPKEDLGKLKSYSKDERYPEAAEYAQSVYDSVMDRINGSESEVKELEPILFAELYEDCQAEFEECLYQRIDEFMLFNGRLPEDKDKKELIDDLCNDYSAYNGYYEGKQIVVDDTLYRLYDDVLKEIAEEELAENTD